MSDEPTLSCGRVLSLLCWFLMLSLSGCDTSSTLPVCDAVSRQVVERISSGRFRGLSLAREGDDLYALWSRPEGSFLRPLAPNGAPRGRALRWGPACPGGMDALSGSPLVVACATAGAPNQAKPGRLLLFQLRGGERQGAGLTVTSLEGFGEGVQLARADERIIIAWHDSSQGGAEAWRSETDSDLRQVSAPEQISSPRVSAGPPHIYIDGDVPLLIWAETWLRNGRNVGQIVLQRGDDVPQRVSEASFGFPRPQVTRDRAGLVVGFRDVQRPLRQAGLYLQRLDERLRPVGLPRRTGRADGRGAPILRTCGDTLFTAAPRSRTDAMSIGIGGFNQDLQRVVAQSQVYEAERRFNDVAALCLDGRLLLLAAEEWTAEHPTARLITLRLSCDQG